VLASYATSWSSIRLCEATCGGVPSGLLPGYTASMVLAAAGYFALTYFLFFHVDPDKARIAGRFRYSLFMACICSSSAIRALAAAHLGDASATKQRSVAGHPLVLALVGLGSALLLLALLSCGHGSL